MQIKTKTLDLNVTSFIFDALFCDTKHVCISAGRRTGKTYNTIIWLIAQLLKDPDKQGLWVDTVQVNLVEYVDLYFRRILKELWTDCKFYKQEKKLVLPNKSILHLRSAEKPEHIEGFGYSCVVLNEAGIILKKENLWLRTIQPMCKDAMVRIVGTPKTKNFFHTLFSEMPKISQEWKSFKFTAYESPYWKESQLAEIKRLVLDEVWQQEYMAEFTSGSTFSIINKSYKESWRDDRDTEYTYEHPFIQNMLKDSSGYWFACFDGGMNANCNACILGFHNNIYQRDILIKEIFSEFQKEDSHAIAMKAKDFLSRIGLNYRDVKLFGDPALMTHRDDDAISSVLESRVNLLDSLRQHTDHRYKGLYANRKTARLGALKRDIATLRSDNKPTIIVIKGKEETRYNPDSFGCYSFYDGCFENGYKFEVKDGNITKDLDQNHPIVDVVDAYTYYLLDTRPFDTAYREQYNKPRERLTGFIA